MLSQNINPEETKNDANENIVMQEQPYLYYQTLKHYHPCCYFKKSVPFFLVNKNYQTALPCLVVLNIIFILIIILTFVTPVKHQDDNFQKQLNNINILVLILIDVTYLLTLFMNPGIVSPLHMEKDEFSEVRYCQRCNRYINADMQHCIDCEVCVEDLDHHCGFFGKCIAGKQRFAFHGFIVFIFVGFLTMLASLTTILGDN